MKKVFVIGLDCATPDIVFKRSEELPNLHKLISNGVSAPFRTVHPPITIPAWMAMCTGKDAGEQGIYGFRHRKEGTYNETWLSMSDRFKEPAIWDILGDKGLKSCIVGVPPSYPPLPLNGNRISCFMTPDSEKDYTYPGSLKKEIEDKYGSYKFDVDYRTNDRDKLKEELFAMTRQHMEVVKYLIKAKEWDFFMFVEIGIDRLHHAFWKFYDKDHPAYVPGNKYEGTVLEYYKMVDAEIGNMLELLDDDTVVFVVSDHGAKAMKGTFCINQWLIEKGYLVLKNRPEGIKDISRCDIDWKRTKVWAWGGYYSRVFFNVKDREKEGTIVPFRYNAWRNKLIRELEDIKGPSGENWETKAHKPEDLYNDPKGDYPDLMVYFDDLSWRAAGSIGHDTKYLSENDTGPDDAMHDWNGIFVMYDSKNKTRKRLDLVNILDFAPTVLDVMDVKDNRGMSGVSVLERL